MFKNLIILLLILAIFYISLFDKCYEFFNSKSVKADLDGEYYSVVDSYSDYEQAAEIMADINQFSIKLIKELKNKYIGDSMTDADIAKLHIDELYLNHVDEGTEYDKGRNATLILIKRFSPKNTSENEPDSPDKTSYTFNKGEKIALCLREKVSGQNKFHSTDIIRFVMLHELTHIITPELSHTKRFWKNFKFLLEFCDKHNLYTSPNYGRNNEVYCGLNITFNPVYDTDSSSSYFK